jgi:hypothetical protein
VPSRSSAELEAAQHLQLALELVRPVEEQAAARKDQLAERRQLDAARGAVEQASRRAAPPSPAMLRESAGCVRWSARAARA